MTWRALRGRGAIARVSAAVCCATLGLAAPRGELVRAQSRPQPPVTAGDVALARGYPAAPEVALRLYVPAGRVRLVTWTRDSIDVRGSIGATSTPFGGGSRTHVKIGVESKRAGDPRLPQADWVVTVPRGARVWVKMIDGTLDVRGTAGEVELYAVRGRIDVSDAAGVTSVESIDAPVTITRVEGDVRVRGGSGAVRLSDVRGTLSVATVSGAASLVRVQADGRVETIGGAIAFAGGSLGGATLELQSHAGDITLALDRAQAPVLSLSSRAGPVRGDTLRGSAANGRIVARSFKGRIVVAGR